MEHDNDVFSISTYDDDNVRDMMNSDLFRREWTIVGTEPPLTKGKVADITEHLILNFHQIEEGVPEDETANVKPRPILLKHNSDYQLEMIPVYPNILGKYYEYFSRCVSLHKGDYLLNVCTTRKKSPCVDIPNCVLAAIPEGSVRNLDCFTVKNMGSYDCVVYVPNSIIYEIISALNDIGISIVPSLHDGMPYNSIRTRISDLCTEFSKDAWSKDSRYIREFSRYAPCNAVTTATLTVSFVLGVVRGPRSRYNNKKSLEIVVHAIK